MKLGLILLVTVGIVGLGSYAYWQRDTSDLPEELRGGTGIYIVDSSICINEDCATFKELLPVELTLVPVADYLPICERIEKGWCKETSEMATATLKGYFDDALSVRTFYLSKLK